MTTVQCSYSPLVADVRPVATEARSRKKMPVINGIRLTDHRPQMEATVIDLKTLKKGVGPNFSYTAEAGTWVFGDISSIADGVASVLSDTNLSTNDHSNIFKRENGGAPPALDALNLMSGVSVINGMMRFDRGRSGFIEAKAADDVYGQFAGALNMATAASTVVADAPVIPMEIVNYAVDAAGKTVPAGFQTATAVFGGGMSSLFYTFLGLNIFTALIRSLQLRYEFWQKRSEGPLETLKFMQEAVMLTREEEDEIIQAVIDDPSKALKSKSKEMDKTFREQVEKRFFAAGVGKPIMKHWGEKDRLVSYIGEKLLNRQKKKEGELFGRLGRVASKKFRDKAPLLIKELEQNPNDEKALQRADKLVKTISIAFHISTFNSAMSMVGCVAGVMLAIAGIVVSGGTAAIVLGALSLALSLVWFGVDLHELITSFMTLDPGRFDKLVMTAMSIIATVTLVVGALLTTGWATLALFAIVGIAWAIVMLALIINYYRKNKKSST